MTRLLKNFQQPTSNPFPETGRQLVPVKLHFVRRDIRRIYRRAK